MRSTPSTQIHVDGPINHLPSECILMVTDNLSGFTDINSLMRTNRRHLQLLMPIILDRAIISPPSDISSGNPTILFWAVRHGYVLLLRRLLQRPMVDTILNAPDRFGATPLHFTTFRRYDDVVEMLLNKGANPNATMDDEMGDGWTTLHLAVSLAQRTLVELLLAAGANTEAITYANGDTPLLHFARIGHREMWSLMVQHGENTLSCRMDGSNIQEYVEGYHDKWWLATRHTLGYIRPRSIGRLCGCFSCTRRDIRGLYHPVMISQLYVFHRKAGLYIIKLMIMVGRL